MDNQNQKRNSSSCYCERLSCPYCRDRYKFRFVWEIEEKFAKSENPGFLTIIPEAGAWMCKDPKDFDLHRAVKRANRKLAKGLPTDCIAAGAVDFSLNVFENDDGLWSPHLHLVVSRTLEKAELEHLRNLFPNAPDKGVYKAVTQKPIAPTELGSTAEYTYKSFFTRRSSYIADPNSGRNPYLDSRTQALSVKENAELQAALENYSVYDTLVLIGLKRKRTGFPADVRFMRTSRTVT